MRSSSERVSSISHPFWSLPLPINIEPLPFSFPSYSSPRNLTIPIPPFLLNPNFSARKNLFSFKQFFWFLAEPKLQNVKASPACPYRILSGARLWKYTITLLPSTPWLKNIFCRYCSGLGNSGPSLWFCWVKKKNWRPEIFLTCPSMRTVACLAEPLAHMTAQCRGQLLW